MKLFYFNADDPRVYVYRDDKGPYSYGGVTLNFAHGKVWTIAAALLILMLPMWFPLLVNPTRLFSPPATAAFILLHVTYCVCFVVLTVVMAFRGASRDLKRYPGPKGPREPKGVAK